MIIVNLLQSKYLLAVSKKVNPEMDKLNWYIKYFRVEDN